MLKTCAGAFAIVGALQNNFIIKSQEILTSEGEKLQLRKATEEDIADSTLLIRKAYQYWPDHGVPVSPANQSEERTRSHLVEGGFVLTNDAGDIVGTFTLENAVVDASGDAINVSYSNPANELSYAKKEGTSPDPRGQYLVFKKLAIVPECARQGLGRRLYDISEAYAQDNDYDGVLLETVSEADWLYQWYLGMGFEVVGAHRYPQAQIDTLLLIKKRK